MIITYDRRLLFLGMHKQTTQIHMCSFGVPHSQLWIVSTIYVDPNPSWVGYVAGCTMGATIRLSVVTLRRVGVKFHVPAAEDARPTPNSHSTHAR
jgi:hypothetical protein